MRQKVYVGALLLPLFHSRWWLDLSIWLVKKPSKTQHYHWLQLDFKHLVMQHNQQADYNCDIKSLVPKTPRLRINHKLDWLVTVLFWCRNKKPTNYEGMSASFIAVKKLLRLNPYFDACLLSLFGLWYFNNTWVWMRMI